MKKKMRNKNNLIGAVMYLILLFVVTIISLISFTKAMEFFMNDNLVGLLACLLISGSLLFGVFIIGMLMEEAKNE